MPSHLIRDKNIWNMFQGKTKSMEFSMEKIPAKISFEDEFGSQILTSTRKFKKDVS